MNWKPLYDFLAGEINFDEACQRLCKNLELTILEKVEKNI